MFFSFTFQPTILNFNWIGSYSHLNLLTILIEIDLQGCHILEKSWKVLDFFCCPGKSLKVLEFCLLVLESPGKIFIKFSRNLPGHKVKFVFFMITGTLQLYKAIVEKISVVKFVQKALLYC